MVLIDKTEVCYILVGDPDWQQLVVSLYWFEIDLSDWTDQYFKLSLYGEKKLVQMFRNKTGTIGPTGQMAQKNLFLIG